MNDLNDNGHPMMTENLGKTYEFLMLSIIWIILECHSTVGGNENFQVLGLALARANILVQCDFKCLECHSTPTKLEMRVTGEC